MGALPFFVAHKQKQAAAKQTFVFKILIEEITMQTTRLQKQHRITLSSLTMGLSFLRSNWGLFNGSMGFEYPDYDLITKYEEKYYASIRQPRCRNGG